MNILIASPYALCTPHFETELEIAQKHLDRGDTVTYLRCDSDLAICDWNYFHDSHKCKLCIKMRKDGLKLLSAEVIDRRLMILTQQDRTRLQGIRKSFSGLNDLRSYFIEHFDVGCGTLSSLVGFLREPEPDLRHELQALMVERMVLWGTKVYFSMLNHLSEDSFDTVYIFNGRFFALRAVVRACQLLGVKFFTHDRGANKGRYQLYEGMLPHDIDGTTSLIRQAWENAASTNDRKSVARQFFENARHGVATAGGSFTDDQTDGLLPSNWNESKLNVVIFLSSEDEFVAIGDSYTNPIYRDQNDGINKIITSLLGWQDIQIYLRIHPNLKGLRNSQIKFLSSLRSENLNVILADSPVSSYALMNSASKVLTFGSTTGIEATFWGKPSIMAGRSFYQNLGATYNPSSHEEVLDLILSDLTPRPKEGALMYGYYQMTRGIPFEYFRASEFFRGQFYSKKYKKFYDLSPKTHPILSRLNISYLKRQAKRLYVLLQDSLRN